MNYLVKIETTVIAEAIHIVEADSASLAFQSAKTIEAKRHVGTVESQLISVTPINPSPLDQQILMATLGQSE